jgi:Putative peptidoglycan binding domain
LREALAARHDGDFIVDAPVRRRAPARRKKVGAAARLLSLALQHPLRIGVALLLAGGGGMIAWNALVLQTAHHPAPLFNHRDPAVPQALPVPPARPVAPATEAEPESAAESLMSPAPMHAQNPVPSPPPRAAARSTIGDMIRNGGEPPPAARAAQPSAPAIVTTPTKPPVARDAIGEMIRMGGPVPTPPANVGRADSSDVVLSGQRALAKLGYDIKADGIMGSGTRQAIERFERERKLPVTGDFTARTARELSAASGIAVR